MVTIVVLHCDLCGEPIPKPEQDRALCTPDGWWCSSCADSIDDVRVTAANLP